MRPQKFLGSICGIYINTEVKSIIRKILKKIGFFRKITSPIYYKGIAKWLNIDMTHEKYFWYKTEYIDGI